MRKFFERIADHPFLTIGIVLLITLGFLVFIPRLSTDTDFTNYIDKSDPTVAAMQRAEDRYGSQTLFMVAVENEDGIFNTATLTKIDRMQERFEEIIGVDEVTGPLNAQVITGTEKALRVGPASPGVAVPETAEEMAAYRERVMESSTVRDYIIASDGEAAVISIKLKADADQVAVAKEVVSIVEEYDTPPDRIYISGLPYMNLVLTQSMGKDLSVLLPLVILMIVLVLYFSFWSLRGILLPLLVVSLSTLWTLGMMAIFNVPVTIISFILPVILMAIGIAYCIHVLNRYYEEIAAGVDRRTAVIETGLHMVSPVSMAGLTTVAGFLSLLNSFLIPQRHFGVFTAVGVLAAMVLSLVLIPALLAVLKVPKKQIHGNDQGVLARTLSGFERVILRHRRVVLVISVLLFTAFLASLPLLRVETSQREFLGDEHPVVQAIDVMERHFSGSEQVMIEIDTGTRDGLKDPALLNEVVALQEFLESKGVNKTISLADMVREMNQKFHADDPVYYVIPEDRKLVSQLLLLFTFQGGNLGNMAMGDFSAGEVMGLYTMGGSSEQVKLAREVQEYLDQRFTGSVRVEMVGQTRVVSSLFSRITKSQITSLGTSIVAAGLIVTLLMGSLVAGLVSLLPLALTVVINFGVMAYSGTPLDMSTLMVSSIAIGIGIDYAIHFISRFRREVRAGEAIDRALQATIQTAGRGIAYNALALALGFVILLLSSFKGTSNFGLLIAMTMVISALSAFTVIPAILITWHPRFLTRTTWKKDRSKEKGRIKSNGRLTMKNKRLVAIAILVVALFSGGIVLAEELSGNEILARVDEQEEFLREGNLITTLRFDNNYADGTTATNLFASLSKRVEGGLEYSLIYFVEPEDVSGTIFLWVKPAGEDARLWLYLPALGMAKELVAEEQEQSFAGSTFSYRDVGSREMADKYDAELTGEEMLHVGDESRPVYVLALTAKPDADVDFPTAKMWVDKEQFLMLRIEDYNAAGNLEQTMEVLALGEFEGRVTADQMIASDLLKESSTRITFLERRRPDEEFSDALFDSENLATFDPAVYGLTD